MTDPLVPPVDATTDATVVLENVVLVYPHLFDKHAVPGSAQPPKYQTGVLLPVGFDMSPLMKLAAETLTKKHGSDAIKLFQAGAIKSPFRKQMEKAAAGQDGYSSDPNAYYINCATDRQPNVVDQNVQPVLDPTKIYSGVICNVQVNAFAWTHPTGGRGLSFGLVNVQIVKDGPRIAGATPDPSKVFKAIPGAATQTSAQIDENMKALFGATH